MSIALVAVTLSPLVRDPLDDSFPLSTYPMFAARASSTLTLDYAVGVAADGTSRTLSPHAIGTSEVLQAGALIEGAVHGGRGRAHALCEQIAARIAADDALRDVVAIRIVTGTHDTIPYLVDRVVGHEREHVRCKVDRGAP